MRRETRDLAADDPGNDEAGLGSTVLIRAPVAGAATEDGRAHYLCVVAGERAGLRIELGGKPIVIGRVPPADLVIDDSQISRKHCRVSLVMDEVYVADLGSSNGTLVDGKRIASTGLLPPGARLQIGGHVLEHEFRSRKEVEASKELDRDLESARQYVHSLIPPPLTEGPIRTEWILLPSARLGGDVFGYHQLDPRTFAIYLLDVSGHGTGAAMHAVSVTNVLRRDALPGVDMRDPATATLEQARPRLDAVVKDACDREGVTYDLQHYWQVPYTPFAPDVVAAVERAAQTVGARYKKMRSGAGHDAQYMAAVGPAGMIFVPSRDGRSHCEEEFTAIADIEDGANTLLLAALELAGRA